jgi:hypothetical protein
MTFFHKPKPEPDPAPKACVLCGARVGSVALRSFDASAREMPARMMGVPQWICRACFERYRGTAPDN